VEGSCDGLLLRNLEIKTCKAVVVRDNMKRLRKWMVYIGLEGGSGQENWLLKRHGMEIHRRVNLKPYITNLYGEATSHLKMEAVCFSEALVYSQNITRLSNP
jgi:hypothetical protein